MPTVPTAMPFAALGVRPASQRALAAMNISDPTPVQAGAIPLLLDGQDVIAQARTGSGKTLAFGLPLVERCDPSVPGVQALVLVPTRELAIQVGDVLRQLTTASRLRLALTYGGRALGPEQQVLRTAQVVIGTPGRTLDHVRQRSLALGGVRFLVLDEADEMLDRGFAPDVERILAATPRTRQTALFSATMPDWVADAARRHQRTPASVAVDPGSMPSEDIEHVVYDIHPDAKLGALRTLLDERGDAPVIVFGRTKHGVKKLAQRLVEMGYPTAALQGNLSQNARERVMRDFRGGTVPILLATNVAARGLDVQGVERVINYELPESAEWFTHRVGRTGRMGAKGQAITLLTPEDSVKWKQIEKALGRRLPRQVWPHGAAAMDAPGPRSVVRLEPLAPRRLPSAPVRTVAATAGRSSVVERAPANEPRSRPGPATRTRPTGPALSRRRWPQRTPRFA